MSSASVRVTSILGRALRGLFWTALFVALAAGGAGLVSAAWHAPGTAARAELTYAADAALHARLDGATGALREIADEVERLADEAKAALAVVANADPEALQAILERGGEAATVIERRTGEARAALAGVPGEGPGAAVEHGRDVLLRRSTVLAALDAAGGLATHWRAVAARSIETANLTSRIARHDETVLAAAAEGRASRWARAIDILDQALLVVADVATMRARLVAGDDGTVLDEWIRRNRDYDVALRNLYAALRDSDGVVTVEVRNLYREEGRAREQLPPDRRTIVVIVSEVTRGGLTEAVIAIEDAQALIDEAVAQGEPDESGATNASAAPAP